MPAAEFWDSTPRELATFLAAASARQADQYRLARYLAWMILYYDRLRQPPPLERALDPPERSAARPAASWTDQWNQLRAIYVLCTGQIPQGASA
jgi:hypothetical protein